MPYIVQTDDNSKLMLVDYDTGCGCCAEYRAINVTEDDTFYDTKYMDEGKVTEAVREQIAVLYDHIRELQEYALGKGLDLRGWAYPDSVPSPLEQQQMAARHDVVAFPPYEGDVA